jgi:hypothetical protein
VLDGRDAVEVEPIAWLEWWNNDPNLIVAEVMVDQLRMTTAFLGTDTSAGPKREIFATVLRWDGLTAWLRRYSTWAEAEVGRLEYLDPFEEPGSIVAWSDP